ncbi:MAG: hypothetical protein AB7G47_19855 [Mycolicibacterium sp.]|uniref:hypothetical protein n=1 Tax=Mycolicibacterium sp. TaxID=2320850 RepID=UPI003D09AD01
MAAETVTVTTWLVSRGAGILDGTIWVPADGTISAAIAEARRQHGGNALAIRRPADRDWTGIDHAHVLDRH